MKMEKILLKIAITLLLTFVVSCTKNDDKTCEVCSTTNCEIMHVQCKVCNVWDCEITHIQCEICDGWDCEKEHVQCEVCGDWDCEKSGCGENQWTISFGIASFVTDKTWKITGNGITQEWSDAVQTTDCRNKTTFNGGNSTSGFNIDCRSNPGQKGDLFSWRAVAEVKNICPEGWRVPTRQDFIDLDIAMGGPGLNRPDNETNSQFVNENYISRWGGAFGGYCTSDGTITALGSCANYWSKSENEDLGGRLYFSVDGLITPQRWGSKYYGFPLRCIR